MNPLAWKLLLCLVPLMVLVAVLWDLACEAATWLRLRRGGRIFA